MIFPKREGKIKINLAAVITNFGKKPYITLEQIVLAYIYRAGMLYFITNMDD